MKITSYILRIALLILSAFFLGSTITWAQKNPLQLIEGSDDIRLDGKTGNYIVRGNVKLVQDDTKMFCDSAFYNMKKRIVRAYGHVHINKQDTLNMFCDSLFYNMETEFAKLWGNVRVRDNEYKLITDSLDFYAKENKAVYRRNGEITSILSSEKLTSTVGYIYTKANNFFFRDNVVYTNEEYKITTDSLKFHGKSKKTYFFGPTNIYGPDGDMYCEKGWYSTANEEGVFEKNAFIEREKESIYGDSLYYNGKEERYIGKGNVIIRDTSNNIEFNGDYAWSSKIEQLSFITGHALAKRFEEDKDTLFIHADTLFNHLDSLNESRLMIGFHNVKIFKPDMQGVCDSLTYDRSEGIMNLYTNPMIWAKNAQLSGDTITVYEKDNDIKRAYLRLSALVITEVDTGKYYNQIAGKSMNAFFDSTQIRRVDILGNAKTVYFLEDEKDEDTIIAVERSGMNRIYSSDISLYFKKGEITSASYRQSPDGMMYPMDKIAKKEERVEEFKWDVLRRPISWETMIMTPVEFEVWKLWEKQKADLIAIKRQTSKTPLPKNHLQKSFPFLEKYVKENREEIAFVTSEENDSIPVIENVNYWLDQTRYLLEERTEIFDLIRYVKSQLILVAEGKNWIDSLDTISGRIISLKPIDSLTTLNDSLVAKKVLVDSLIDSTRLLGWKIFDKVLDFRDVTLTLFPDYQKKMTAIEDWNYIEDSLFERRAVLDSLNFSESDTTQSDIHLTNDIKSGADTTNLSNDSIAHLKNNLPKPKLTNEEKLAKKIFETLNFSDSIEINTDSTTITIPWVIYMFEKATLSTALSLLDAIKIDILNTERAALLHIYRKITEVDKKETLIGHK